MRTEIVTESEHLGHRDRKPESYTQRTSSKDLTEFGKKVTRKKVKRWNKLVNETFQCLAEVL